MQKTVSEVLKTWYFPYSAFLSAGQWGSYSPPAYAIGHQQRLAFNHSKNNDANAHDENETVRQNNCLKMS